MKENTRRHRALIKFLQNFELYKNTKITEIERSTEDLQYLDTYDINRSVNLICDFLNQPTGSAGNVQLYRLLQSYFTDLDKRKKINEIIG